MFFALAGWLTHSMFESGAVRWSTARRAPQASVTRLWHLEHLRFEQAVSGLFRSIQRGTHTQAVSGV